MAKLTNSPTDRVVLALEQRKSFSLGLWFKDHREHPVDLTGAVLRLSAATYPEFPGDIPELLVEKAAVLSNPSIGFARIDLQANELDLNPGNYPFVVTLITVDGFSAVVVKGELDVQFNPETAAVGEEFLSADPSTSLDVQLRSQQSIHVDVSHMIFAGPGVFTEGEKAKLAGIESGAEVNVNADWNASGGDAEILNKPDIVLQSEIGTAAAADVEDFVAAREFGTAAAADVEDFVAAREFGTAAAADVEDFVAAREFGTAAAADVEDFVAAREFGTAAAADVEDFAAAGHHHSIGEVDGLEDRLDILETLPNPVNARSTSDSWTISSGASTWADVPGAAYTFTNLPRPLLVEVHFRAQGSSPNGSTYPAIGVATTGALVTTPTSAPDGTGVGLFYYTAFTRSTANTPMSNKKTFILPAGTTVIKLQNMRNNTEGTPALSYAGITITPIRWVL